MCITVYFEDDSSLLRETFKVVDHKSIDVLIWIWAVDFNGSTNMRPGPNDRDDDPDYNSTHVNNKLHINSPFQNVFPNDPPGDFYSCKYDLAYGRLRTENMENQSRIKSKGRAEAPP